MKFNLWFISGLIYIFFWVGIGYESIGRQCSTEVYGGGMPFIMFAALVIPFICGYLGGKK